MTDEPRRILAPNWQRILTKAHSIRAMAAVVVFEGLNQFWPYIEPYIPIDRVWVGLIAMVISMLAIYFRLSYQPSVQGETKNEKS